MNHEPITLHDGELAALIREANSTEPRDKHVSLNFGAGWVSLRWWECKWTLPILAKMRGIPT